jgi:hypothetical protein
VAGYPSTSLYGPLPQTGFNPDREALSGAIALMVVGLPLWLIHWALVQRMAAGEGEKAAAERNSIVRSAYFSLVMIYLLVAGAVAFVTFLREGLARALGATDPFSYVSLSDSVSTALVLLVAWLLHAWWRGQDGRDGRRLEGAAAWICRLYLYAAALIALVATIGAVSGLLAAGIDAAARHDETMFPIYPSSIDFIGSLPTAAWWVRPILSMLAQFVVWAPLWAVHWLYSVRLAASDEPQALAERASRVRLSYFVAVVAIGVGYVVWGLSQGLAAALGAVVGVGTWAGQGPLWRDIVVAPATALPLALAWWWHRRRVLREATSSGWLDSPARVIGYLTALIGLGAFGAGLASAFGMILQRLAGGGLAIAYDLETWRWQAVQAIALAVVALPVWLWPWLASRQRRGLDPAAEARSTARRAYLFAAVGATILTTAVAAAFIVDRTTRLVVGLQSDSLGSEIGYAVGTLIAILPLLAYHLGALRADLTPNGESAAPVAVEASPVDVSPAPATQELVIVGPPGADLEALTASLADRLPEGYSIRAGGPGDIPAE